MVREVLRPVLMVPLPNRHKEIAAHENHPAPVVKAIFGICIRSEDPFAINNTRSVEPKPVDYGRTSFWFAERVADIDPSIFRIVRMESDVVQTCVFSCENCRTNCIMHSRLFSDKR